MLPHCFSFYTKDKKINKKEKEKRKKRKGKREKKERKKTKTTREQPESDNTSAGALQSPSQSRFVHHVCRAAIRLAASKVCVRRWSKRAFKLRKLNGSSASKGLPMIRSEKVSTPP